MLNEAYYIKSIITPESIYRLFFFFFEGKFQLSHAVYEREMQTFFKYLSLHAVTSSRRSQ